MEFFKWENELFAVTAQEGERKNFRQFWCPGTNMLNKSVDKYRLRFLLHCPRLCHRRRLRPSPVYSCCLALAEQPIENENPVALVKFLCSACVFTNMQLAVLVGLKTYIKPPRKTFLPLRNAKRIFKWRIPFSNGKKNFFAAPA